MSRAARSGRASRRARPPTWPPNRLSVLVDRLRAERRARSSISPSSNPTAVGLPYPDAELAAALAAGAARRTAPSPRGPAVRAPRRGRGSGRARAPRVDPEHVFLTASTSEAYGFLFKLLCDAGRRGAGAAAELSLVRAPVPARRRSTARLRARAGARLRARSRPGRGGARPAHPRRGRGLAQQPDRLGGERRGAGRAGRALRRARHRAHLRRGVRRLPGRRTRRCRARWPPAARCASRWAACPRAAGCPTTSWAGSRLAGPAGGARRGRPAPRPHRRRVPVGVAARSCARCRGCSSSAPSIRARHRRARRGQPRRRGRAPWPARPRRGCFRPTAAGRPCIELDPETDEEELALRWPSEHGVLVQPGYFFDFDRGAHAVVSLLAPPGDIERGLAALGAVLAGR